MIPFNKPWMTGREIGYIEDAHANGKLAGDGPFTTRCHDILCDMTGSPGVLLTHSCTAALEMSCQLIGLAPGDEVIMPSFTFVSTANAVVQRGAVPVFVDIREDTLNIDENLLEPAITPRTRAILVMHYAGVSCAMDEIVGIANKHGLAVIEDAAQGIQSRYRGRPLGSIGDLGAISFHETKNIICGEGGCLQVNRPELMMEAEIIREKGTDRNRFFRGEVDKYTWQSIGSSYLPGELVAAFLAAQLENAADITHRRLECWHHYHHQLASLEEAGLLRRPKIPAECEHNGHIYHVLLAPGIDRNDFLAGLKQKGVHAVFHYVPLHSAPAGERHGRVEGSMALTDDLSGRLVRLPLWVGITPTEQDQVVEAIGELLR